MRRADRLFRIVQMLRSGRLKTARSLAERLQVSERTIYRDVRDLQLAGQPIEGEVGVGYTLRREFDLPPLLFTPEELTALVLGARLVKAWGGVESVEAATSALARIEAVLPSELASRLDTILMYAPGFRMRAAERKMLDCLHMACANRRAVQFHYTRLNGCPSDRSAPGSLLLERHVDLSGMVRAADRLQDVSAGPHRCTAGAGAPVRAKARAAAAGLSA